MQQALLFPVGALVVYDGQVVPIVHRFVEPAGAQYTIHTRGKDNELMIHFHVTFGQLVAAINAYARWCVGDEVHIGPWKRYVKARRWSFRQGTVYYQVNDYLHEGRGWVYTQEELAARVHAYETSST